MTERRKSKILPPCRPPPPMRRQEKHSSCLKEPSSKPFSSTVSMGALPAPSSVYSQPMFIPTTASTFSFPQDRNFLVRPRRWIPSAKHVSPLCSIGYSCLTDIPSASTSSRVSTRSGTPVSETKSTTITFASSVCHLPLARLGPSLKRAPEAHSTQRVPISCRTLSPSARPIPQPKPQTDSHTSSPPPH